MARQLADAIDESHAMRGVSGDTWLRKAGATWLDPATHGRGAMAGDVPNTHGICPRCDGGDEAAGCACPDQATAKTPAPANISRTDVGPGPETIHDQIAEDIDEMHIHAPDDMLTSVWGEAGDINGKPAYRVRRCVEVWDQSWGESGTYHTLRQVEDSATCSPTEPDLLAAAHDLRDKEAERRSTSVTPHDPLEPVCLCGPHDGIELQVVAGQSARWGCNECHVQRWTCVICGRRVEIGADPKPKTCPGCGHQEAQFHG